jgi:FAD/FMN-containing dehydrogenase
MLSAGAAATPGSRMSDAAMQQPADFAGKAFRRGDPGYEVARRASCRNVNLPDRFPDIIVQAENENDVIAAVRLANANSWTIATRSGGHSWSCNHVRDGGMLLDVSRLDAVTIDARQMSAAVGPGCRGNQVNRLLTAQKLFFPIGHCEGVGLGGFLLQGGFGWHSRAVGMACESVLGIDYVGADGALRHASASENADVYWAARGAGPGFFGVITRFYLKLYRRPKVIGAKLAFYTADHLEEIVRWAHQVGPQVPLSIELMFMVSRCIPFIEGPGIMVVAPVFADSIFAAWKDLDFMKTRPPGAKRATPFIPMRLSTLSARVMSHYPDNHRYAVDNMWTRAAPDALLPALKRIVAKLPPAPSHILWMNWAPRLRRPDMAFSFEDEIYVAMYGVWREAGDEDKAANKAARWALDGMTDMAPLATGIQLADENLGARAARFMAQDNLARLDRLKASLDPAGRFHSYMGRPDGQARDNR